MTAALAILTWTLMCSSRDSEDNLEMTSINTCVYMHMIFEVIPGTNPHNLLSRDP